MTNRTTGGSVVVMSWKNATVITLAVIAVQVGAAWGFQMAKQNALEEKEKRNNATLAGIAKSIEEDLHKLGGKMDSLASQQQAQGDVIARLEERINSLPSASEMGEMSAKVEQAQIRALEASAAVSRLERELADLRARITRK